MAEYNFHFEGNWDGDRTGKGELAIGNMRSDFSVPDIMGGSGNGTNPDELLLASAATCYIITLATLVNKKQLPVVSLGISSEGTASETGGLHFEKIIHKPRIVMDTEASDEQLEQADDLPQTAAKHCMVSKALQGNVEITIEPEILKENV